MIELILQTLEHYLYIQLIAFALPKLKPFDRSNVVNHIIMLWFVISRKRQMMEITEHKSYLLMLILAMFAPYWIKNVEQFKWIKTDLWERLMK